MAETECKETNELSFSDLGLYLDRLIDDKENDKGGFGQYPADTIHFSHKGHKLKVVFREEGITSKSTETKKPLVECASDRCFYEPIEVSSQDYIRGRKGCKLTIVLRKKPEKRFLRINAPVDCMVGFLGDEENMILVEKKAADGRHTFLDLVGIDNFGSEATK